MDNSYIKLYRSLLDFEFMNDPEAVSLWIYFLLEAKWKHESKYSKALGETVYYEPGQLSMGRREIASKLGINQHKIDRLIKMFQSCDMIEPINKGRFRLITIKNWKRYQEDEPIMSQKRANDEPMMSTPIRTIRKKEDNNKGEVIKPEKEEITETDLELIKYFQYKLETINEYSAKDLDFNKQAIGLKTLRKKLKDLGLKSDPESIKQVFTWIFNDYKPNEEKWKGWANVVRSIPALCTKKGDQPAKIVTILDHMKKAKDLKDKAGTIKKGKEISFTDDGEVIIT